MGSSPRPESARWGALALVLAAVPWSGAAWAAWSFAPHVGTVLCDTLGNQTQTVAVSDGAGGVITAWIDTRSGGPDVYAQRLDANGGVPPGWPSDGLRVCGAAGLQTGVRVVADGAGGAILAWIDFRAGNADVYAQRITGSGGLAPGWTTDGIAVCTASGTQSDVAVAGDGAQGAVFVWQDGRGSTKDVYALRLLANGARHASWPLQGRVVCDAPNDQFFPVIVASGGGATRLAWQDARFNESDIFAQALDGAGAALWSEGGVLVSAGPGTQEKPRIVGDGSGGMYVGWADYRDTPVVALYLVRLTAAGATAPFWTPDGKPVSFPGVATSDGTLLADGAGGLFVAWVDARSGAKDIYASRIDGLAGVAPGWLDGGTPVCAAGSAQVGPALAPDGAGGVMIAWRDARHDSLHDVFGTRLDGAGSIAAGWIPDGLPFGNARGMQADLAIVPAGAGAAILAWSDFRNRVHWDVYANRMGPDVVLAVPRAAARPGIALSIAPRPMAARATLRFVLPRAGHARLAVHDASGRRVAVLVDAELAAGVHERSWSGRDATGRGAPSGIYFASIEAAGARVVEKVVKLE